MSCPERPASSVQCSCLGPQVRTTQARLKVQSDWIANRQVEAWCTKYASGFNSIDLMTTSQTSVYESSKVTRP
jgi:hypothetical protein